MVRWSGWQWGWRGGGVRSVVDYADAVEPDGDPEEAEGNDYGFVGFVVDDEVVAWVGDAHLLAAGVKKGRKFACRPLGNFVDGGNCGIA